MCWKCDEVNAGLRAWFPIEACDDYERDLEIQRQEYEDYDPQIGE